MVGGRGWTERQRSKPRGFGLRPPTPATNAVKHFGPEEPVLFVCSPAFRRHHDAKKPPKGGTTNAKTLNGIGRWGHRPDHIDSIDGILVNIRRRRGSGGFQPPFPRSRRLEATATANVYRATILSP